MVKIDEEAMVRPELLLVLVNDPWGPVGKAMDVGMAFCGVAMDRVALVAGWVFPRIPRR